jgi:hypothetical protein
VGITIFEPNHPGSILRISYYCMNDVGGELGGHELWTGGPQYSVGKSVALSSNRLYGMCSLARSYCSLTWTRASSSSSTTRSWMLSR